MMLSHPPRCLKGMPSSNEKHVGSPKICEGGGYNKKTIAFCLADCRNELKKYPHDTFATFLQQ